LFLFRRIKWTQIFFQNFQPSLTIREFAARIDPQMKASFDLPRHGQNDLDSLRYSLENRSGEVNLPMVVPTRSIFSGIVTLAPGVEATSMVSPDSESEGKYSNEILWSISHLYFLLLKG
jgi:hypothetical protein